MVQYNDIGGPQVIATIIPPSWLCSRQDLFAADTSSYKPYNGAVRLVEGNTGFNSSGFVEVYLHNEWGTVCGMRNYDADSACRQLGYTEASNYGSAT